MKFWKTMTVWQMEELLRAREQPGIKEGWQQLTDKLHMLESSSGMTGSGVLGDCPRAPAVYFFTIVLAICGRYADAGALKRAMDRYLPDIYSAGYNEPDNQYCLRVAYYRQELNACLQYIMQAAEAYTPETLLKDLLAGINSRHLEAGGVARSMERGIITFRVNLNAWSRTCKAMWSISRSRAAQEVCGRIENGVKQIILTGAPGTGKTYAAKQIAQCMGEEYQLVQFHPSYDYTDFVEGLRPVQLEKHQNGSFVRLDGTFKAFCRLVDLLDGRQDRTPEPLEVFRYREGAWWTRQYVGLFQYRGERVVIGSRFDRENREPFFLRYLIEEFLEESLLVLEDVGGVWQDDPFDMLLAVKLAVQLQQAWKKGGLRAYRSFCHNDSRVRG